MIYFVFCVLTLSHVASYEQIGRRVRKPLVAGNWKMNMLVEESVELVTALRHQVAEVTSVDIVVCPPYTALEAVGRALTDSVVEVGGQNCYVKDSGAFTGEISPKMLVDAGCSWVIVGHSERREYFNENDAFLNQKLRFALASGLKVMFCVGETLAERESGAMESVLTRQITQGLEGLTEHDFMRASIAYEPVWAIGTGKTATPDQAEEAHAFIRDLVARTFGGTIADRVRIQYGGSVKADNAADLMAKPNVDGALVGGASLDAAGFATIVKAAA